MRVPRVRPFLVCFTLAAFPLSLVAVPTAQADQCNGTNVLNLQSLSSESLAGCSISGRAVKVSDLELLIPEAGEGVGQAVIRVDGSDSSLPSIVQLYHSEAGGVAAIIDGAAPIGEAVAVKEMVIKKREYLAELETAQTAEKVASNLAYPSFCGSPSQYKTTGQKWSSGRYQWFANSSGRPSTITEVQRKAAFDAAANSMDASSSVCGSYGTTSLGVGDVGSTSKPVGVKDGTNTMGWKTLSSGTLALTTWWYSGASTTEADMAFTTSVSWYAGTSTIPSTKYDLTSVAAHEIGHAVGLAHVTSTPAQVMYPSVGKGVNRRVKRSGDLYGLQLVY